MADSFKLDLGRRLIWREVYREAELYKAAVRVYTKPLFQWRKALASSTDGRTLYDLAGRGLRPLDAIHRSLERQEFHYRPAVALHYNFNGKHRTLYISPWEERIVDFLIYRIMNERLDRWFSANSYAYRTRSIGLDRCQSRIAAVLRAAGGPVYVVKRDIADYFASVDHNILLGQLAELVESGDYFFSLLSERVRFAYVKSGSRRTAALGIPFGTAVACVFANIYLTPVDREIERVPSVRYFRYADDFLLASSSRDAASEARDRLDRGLEDLRLKVKDSHVADLEVSAERTWDREFAPAREFRHLGLLFRAGGGVALSRDKFRKIRNLFRFAFRRGRRRWVKMKEPRERARILVAIALETIEKGVRNVAILDYYLKHVNDETQLGLLDRWLAEEVLSHVFGGHRKGHFGKLSFSELRAQGLPSLVHRRRLVRRGKVESPFFIWQREQATRAVISSRRAFRGTVARLRPAMYGAGRNDAAKAPSAFSPVPEAAATPRP